MLRGLAREQRHWGNFPDHFTSEIAGSKVHLLDLPGTGTENHRRCPQDVAQITDDLRQRWYALTLEHPGPWGLLAVSLGGMVAMQWCATYASDFERLVLVNSSASNLSAPHRRMNLRVVPQVARALVDKDAVSRERRILSITTRMLTDHERVATEWATYLTERPISRKTAISQILAAACFRAPAKITTPLLVLAGAHDPLADPMCGFRLSRHFQAPLHVHPSAGHDLSLDDPGWLAKQVKTWIG